MTDKRIQVRRSGGLNWGLVVLASVLSLLAPQANGKEKENPDDYTRVYSFSYDEVYQAAEKAAMRLGWRVRNEDKDKGSIQGSVIDAGLAEEAAHFNDRNHFEVHIETVSSKPETKVTFSFDLPNHHSLIGASVITMRKRCAEKLFVELQKVLATY